MFFCKNKKKMQANSTLDNQSMVSELLFYKRVLFQSDSAFMLLDRKFNIVFANAKAQRVLERKILAGMPIWDIFFGVDDPNLAPLVTTILEKEGVYQSEIFAHRFSTRPISVSVKILKDYNESGEIKGYLFYFLDISKNKKLQQALQYLSDYDPVTRFPNRDLFLKGLKKQFSEKKALNKKIFVIFLEFENLKLINSLYGYAVGDTLLKAVGERILSFMPGEEHISRVGGNNFGLFVEMSEGLSSEKSIANTLLNMFNEPVTDGAHDFKVEINLGITVFPDDGCDPAEMLRNASTACYYAKIRSQEHWLKYLDSMRAETTRKHALERDLRRAIKENALEVYYQPKINVKTKKISGVEALLRWRHPIEGFIRPDDFIPLAEETGLIEPLGQWVLKKACEQAKIWQKQLTISVSVNLSAYQFKAQDMAMVVGDVLWETGLAAHSLQLELTESLILENSEKSITALRTLKAMGVSVAVDDFGTGYASLAYIRTFPIDCVKIDQSFIRNMLHNAEDAAIVKTIIELAHHLHFSVVAEGVETKSQLEHLINVGIDEVQGFYFCKPLPVDEITHLLESAASGMQSFY